MQFSIRAVLALTLMAGGICGLMFGVPDEYLMFALSAPWCVLPGALISALVYGRGYVRAFAIGAMPVAFPALFWALVASASAAAVDVDDASTMRFVFAGGVAAVVLAGGTSALVRWVLMPRRSVRAQNAGGEIASATILAGRFATTGPDQPLEQAGTSPIDVREPVDGQGELPPGDRFGRSAAPFERSQS